MLAFAHQFGAPSPPPIQLTKPTFYLNKGHKVMIHLVLQIGRSSLTFPRGLIMPSHNLGVILQSVRSLFWAETGRRLQENFERRSGNRFITSGLDSNGSHRSSSVIAFALVEVNQAIKA